MVLTHGRRTTPARPDGERGATFVLASAVIVALLVFSALGVDIGNAYNVKRQVQAAADAAALAAAQDLPNTATATATAKSFARKNFDVTSADWVGCKDPARLAVLGEAGNECISFSSDRREVRVRIPTTAVKTFFGGFVGKSDIPVWASAKARVVNMRSDRIMPAAVAGLVGTGLLCIEQAGNNMPCSSRERGQFGSLHSPRLNSLIPSSNADQTGLAINYSMSLDHEITTYTGTTAICDGDTRSPCTTSNVNTSLVANHVDTSQGNDVPPVTEGYVTGFTANTTDQGVVQFCGRLQRPDATSVNLLETMPSNCTPPSPTIELLGKTVNGRHIYHWLDDDAKQLFYPEVWALGYAATDQRLAIGNTIYSAGDQRLDCFLAGYRWDAVTKTETLPDCSTVDLTYPWQDAAWTRTVGDTFDTNSYSRNDGSVAFADDWVEGGDDGSPSSGSVTVSGGSLRLNANAAGMNKTITRTMDMRNNAGTLATTATLGLRVDASKISKTPGVLLEVSTNGGSTWTTVANYTKSTANGWTTFAYNVSNHISAATQIRFRTVPPNGGGGDHIDIDWVGVEFRGTGASGVPQRMAPIFRQGMAADTRWGVIPKISAFGSPSAKPITGFWAFYGYTAYTTSTKVQAFDGWVFDPALTMADPENDIFQSGYNGPQTVKLVQ